MQFAASLIKVNKEEEGEELTGTKGRAGHVVKLSLTRRIKGGLLVSSLYLLTAHSDWP